MVVQRKQVPDRPKVALQHNAGIGGVIVSIYKR